MDDDRDRWDRRHETAPPASPEPPEALGNVQELFDALPRSGRALDIACGTGAQTLWLAERGLRVVAIDVSPVAIAAVRRAAHDRGLTDRITAVVTDLDSGLPIAAAPDADDDVAAAFDGDGGEMLDMILCQRFRDPRLYPQIVRRLRSGGIAVITVLSESGATEPGPFHAPAGELAGAFRQPELELLRYRSGDGAESIVVRHR